MATGHLLVIDDDKCMLEMYHLLLQGKGYQVTLSSIPFKRAMGVKRLSPDLLFLDVMVNDQEDGLILLEHLRSCSPTRSVPVIWCTTVLAKKVHERLEALSKQEVPMICKPFDIYKLLRIIQDVLSGTE